MIREKTNLTDIDGVKLETGMALEGAYSDCQKGIYYLAKSESNEYYIQLGICRIKPREKEISDIVIEVREDVAFSVDYLKYLQVYRNIDNTIAYIDDLIPDYSFLEPEKDMQKILNFKPKI